MHIIISAVEENSSWSCLPEADVRDVPRSIQFINAFSFTFAQMPLGSEIYFSRKYRYFCFDIRLVLILYYILLDSIYQSDLLLCISISTQLFTSVSLISIAPRRSAGQHYKLCDQVHCTLSHLSVIFAPILTSFICMLLFNYLIFLFFCL